MKRPVRVWHVVLVIAALYGAVGYLFKVIWSIDPWLFAALGFVGVLAL